MWKPFTIECDVYMLKFIENDGTYKVYMSDLKNIWCNDYSKEDIVNKFKEFNPNIVVEQEEAVSQTIKILNEINNATVTINKNDDEINVKIKSDVLGLCDTKFKLKYELNLSKDENKFTEELVVPMINTISYLEKQQQVLCDLIRKKDRELEEYKMEKGLISRTDLVTEKFNTSCLKAPSDKVILDTFGESKKFWKSFVDKYGDIDVNVMEVKVEPWNQVKRKRKTYNAKTAAKKFSADILYKKD